MQEQNMVVDASQRVLSRAEEDEIECAFEIFDPVGKGVISVSDVRDALDGIDPEKSKSLLRVLPRKGTLTKEEFGALFQERDEKLDDLERVFRLYDTEGKGYISIEDLQRVATDLRESMTEEELQEMIDRADLDEDGVISLDEFRNVMTKKLYA